MNSQNTDNSNIFTSIENIGKYSFGIIKDIYKLFTLEVKLAGKSIVTILILIVVSALLLLSSWFSLLGVLVAWLMSFKLSLILSLFLVSAINLIIAIGLGIYILKISNNLHFKETRKQLEIMRESI